MTPAGHFPDSIFDVLTMSVTITISAANLAKLTKAVTRFQEASNDLTTLLETILVADKPTPAKGKKPSKGKVSPPAKAKKGKAPPAKTKKASPPPKAKKGKETPKSRKDTIVVGKGDHMTIVSAVTSLLEGTLNVGYTKRLATYLGIKGVSKLGKDEVTTLLTDQEPWTDIPDWKPLPTPKAPAKAKAKGKGKAPPAKSKDKGKSKKVKEPEPESESEVESESSLSEDVSSSDEASSSAESDASSAEGEGSESEGESDSESSLPEDSVDFSE